MSPLNVLYLTIMRDPKNVRPLSDCGDGAGKGNRTTYSTNDSTKGIWANEEGVETIEAFGRGDRI